MAGSLEYVDRVFLNFETGAYDWIEVKAFRCVPAGLEASEALRLLLAHERYRDTYVTADSHEEDSVELHGPYWLRALEPGCFRPVTDADLDAALRDFSRRYSDEAEARVRTARYEDEVAPHLAGATAIFRLADLPESSQHEFGWVLEDFMEFVVMNRSVGRLMLVVAAAD